MFSEKNPRFLIFDGRARHDMDRANVHSCAQTEKEAIEDLLDADDLAIAYDCKYERLRFDLDKKVERRRNSRN